MSDFETDLNQKHEALLFEARELDFIMMRAKNYRARKPWVRLSGELDPPYYGGLPNYGSEADLLDNAMQFQAELVEQIYWRGGPVPRKPTQRRPETMELLYGDTERSHVSHEVRELADRLGVSERQIRRKLASLLKMGKIPAAWRVGKQWRPQVELAQAAIRAAEGKPHKPHTHAAAGDFSDYLVKCRRDAERMKRELEETGSKLATCKDWIRLLGQGGLSAAESDTARERVFFALSQLAEHRRWSFCKLFVGMYAAMLNGSAKPVVEAKSFLGLNHAAFYRLYSKQDVREARKLAERILSNPDWTSLMPHTSENADEDLSPFSDWTQKVADQDLWVEV